MKYEKLDPITHIHRRPDMYIGSIRNIKRDEWISGDESFDKIYYEEDVEYNPGLYRIFIEVLSNVIDNVWRSQQEKKDCKRIEITICESTGEMSVLNDGLIIPIENHPEFNIPIPELIFGHLLTSTNYNDNEERLTSGRNGLGVKLTNVFSKEFRIEIANHDKSYKQKWRNNMTITEKAQIKNKKNNKEYVKISWIPDFEKFNLTGYTKEMIKLFYKYCIDVAMICKIPVKINNHKVHIKNFMDYVKLYNIEEKIQIENNKNLEIILSSSTNGYQEIVFTNGIYNRDGGNYVDIIINDILRQLLSKMKSNGKIHLRELKNHFMIFVNAKISNPEFNNQSKDRVMSPSLIPFSLDKKYITSIMKWKWKQDIEQLIEMKEIKDIKKNEKKKIRIESYDPANYAGHSKYAKDCTLILCEGLSAKTFAVIGIEIGWNNKKGRDFFGIMPLRGKCLNVRNATLNSITNNKELMDIANILGLKYKTDYSNDTNFANDLNYGKVLILADADVDGRHITSLLLNYFDVLYPSLLKRKDFLYMMMTPIAKIKDTTFYNEYEYHLFLKKNQEKNFSVKYYKGLGTSSNEEVKHTFGKKIVQFLYDQEASPTLNKVFHQKFSNERKNWLEAFDPTKYIIPTHTYNITDFINYELIRYSIDDCRRNIPNLFDGFKLSQRKIMYSLLKKKLFYNTKSMKVAQLAGYVAETSNYHHGEQCLYDTIIKMAHSFVGSNNLPLLYPDGQFGSRSYGGKDAANGRYIFTKFHNYIPILFSEDDYDLLNFIYDDNEKVEPEFFMPIIPMIFINGCNTGIGTGWSCNMPCYNIQTIIEFIIKWINSKYNTNTVFNADEIDNLIPYYSGFKGTIEKINENKFISKGIFQVKDKNKNIYQITELPIGIWTDRYKEFLEDLNDKKKIKHLKNFSTQDAVHFEFIVCDDSILNYEYLKLSSFIHLSNIVLFDKNFKLKKFSKLSDIFISFCHERFYFYELRKKNCLDKLQHQLILHSNRLRFIQYIQNKKLSLFDLDDDQINDFLIKYKFDHIDNSYNYLFEMSLSQITKTKIEKLKSLIDNIKSQIKTLSETSEGDLWKHDLSNLKKNI